MVTVGWVTTAVALAAVNVVLLVAVGVVWLSNYRRFRTSLLLGLVGFAAALAVHDLVTIYSFARWGSLYADSTFAKQFFTGLQGVQLLALVSLNYSTLR